MVSPPPPSPITSKGKVLFWSHSPTRTLVHPSNVGKLCPCHSPINTQNQLGILVELRRFGRMHGAHEAAELIVGILHKSTIHSTLDCFLKLLYENLETSPKRHIAACTMFKTSMDTFRKKLLMLLDDVEHFFLWVVAAMLDGRRIGFDWLNSMWEKKREWLNVNKQFRSIHHLMSEVEQDIAD